MNRRGQAWLKSAHTKAGRHLLAFVLAITQTVACAPQNSSDALVSAARMDDTNRASFLLAKGVPVNAMERGMLGQNALAAAGGNGNVSMVQFLLKNGANPNLRSGHFRTTPLIEAISLGDPNLPIVRMLLDAGADPNLADAQGNRPLDYARAEEKGTVAVLLSKGASSGKLANTAAHQPTGTNSRDWKSIPFKVKPK